MLKELAEAHLENSLLNEERQHWRAALDSYRESAQIRERLLIAQSDARAHALDGGASSSVASAATPESARGSARIARAQVARYDGHARRRLLP